jgi:hypothetical protein
MLTKELQEEIWQMGNDDIDVSDFLLEQATNYIAYYLPEKLNNEADIDEATEIYMQGFYGSPLVKEPINSINSYINAIADILATNDLDPAFKTAILRQIKSIKAILRKEVLK